MASLELPPRGALPPNSDVDPLKYYYLPLVGRIFRARIDLGLALLDGRVPRLLEVGYGSGLLLPTLRHLADHLEGVDLESDPRAVRESLARIGVTVERLQRGDVCALPLPDGGFDGVVAFSILEHLRPEALPGALAEVHRVLAPGGRFLVGCPAVHKGMNVAFAAIGFRGIDHHHHSSIHDVLAAAEPHFTVERRAALPRALPLGLALYGAVLLRRRG